MLRRNVLIFHSGALGDFILIWPLALALGRIHPQSRIILVTHASKGKLAERVLRLESSDADSGWHHLFGDPVGLPETCRRQLAGAHSIYSFVATAGDVWSANVAALSGGVSVTLLNPNPPADFQAHFAEYLVSQLTGLPVIQTAVRQILASIADKGISTNRAAAGPIVVHPGSGAREKCWPPEHYARLVERLTQSRRAVKVILGEVELERMSPADIQRFQGIAPVVQPANYMDLLTELAAASAFVGNDSGPGHLAGIIGVPTLSLFGPTDPTIWRPLGPRVCTLRANPIQTLDPDAVYNQLAEFDGG